MTLALAAIAALMVSLVVAVRPGAVRADGSIPWGGNGADQLPCANGAHWVLSPSDGIDSAILHVGNATYTMTENGGGSWSADSAGDVPSDQSQVWVEFTGAGDAKDHLQLSHCLEGSSQSASASASQSASASASQSASASASQSASASTSQSPEGSVEAATPVASASTPNTAFTAPSSTSSGALLAGLLLVVSLITLAALNVRTARRRR
jgi:hypothetical protein